MGNGQYVSVLFVIPVIIDIHRQRFEIFTLVSKIHDNVDLVMGMKNIFELEDTDERKHMMDREILDKYINLDNSCLTKTEKTQVRDLLYKYKVTFSLRDKIVLCPNIKIEINVTDKSPFFIRPFHANKEDKVILDKETK